MSMGTGRLWDLFTNQSATWHVVCCFQPFWTPGVAGCCHVPGWGYKYHLVIHFLAFCSLQQLEL